MVFPLPTSLPSSCPLFSFLLWSIVLNHRYMCLPFPCLPSSSEYLDRIKTQVMDWFRNIEKQPLEIVEAADGTLITSHPEDMFNVIHVQVISQTHK